jgi:hypothetical protein
MHPKTLKVQSWRTLSLYWRVLIMMRFAGEPIQQHFADLYIQVQISNSSSGLSIWYSPCSKIKTYLKIYRRHPTLHTFFPCTASVWFDILALYIICESISWHKLWNSKIYSAHPPRNFIITIVLQLLFPCQESASSSLLVSTTAHNPCLTNILSTHQFPHINNSWSPFQFLCPFFIWFFPLLSQ